MYVDLLIKFLPASLWLC